MSRPFNTKKKIYVVYLKEKGSANPIKKDLNHINCPYLIVNAITVIEAHTIALEWTRKFGLFEYTPYHTRVMYDESLVNFPNCKGIIN